MNDTPKFNAKLIAEFIGTFGIVFFGCGAIMVADRFPVALPALMIPLVFGMAVAAMIYALGHISGAHFNPAVSLAFALTRHFPLSQVFGYWLAQALGATLASAFLGVLLPIGTNYGETIPHLNVMQACGWEFVLTFFLMFVIIAVATDTRAEGTMAGAAIGATVAIAAIVGGPLTGASMNPARSLGPALVSGHFTDIWLYVVGPLSGAACAAWVYKFIRCDSHKGAEGCC